MIKVRGVFLKTIGKIVFTMMIFCVVLCPVMAGDPCLDLIHEKNQPKDSDYYFDIKFDQDRNGRSFSCGPEIRASEARKALDALRYGVLYGDKTSIDSVIEYPLTVRVKKTLDSNEKSKIVIIHNYQEWAAFQKVNFTKNLLALVACAHLKNVRIHSGRSPGFEMGNGTIWFQRFVDSSKVWVSAINLSPLNKERLINSCVGTKDNGDE